MLQILVRVNRSEMLNKFRLSKIILASRYRYLKRFEVYRRKKTVIATLTPGAGF